MSRRSVTNLFFTLALICAACKPRGATTQSNLEGAGGEEGVCQDGFSPDSTNLTSGFEISGGYAVEDRGFPHVGAIAILLIGQQGGSYFGPAKYLTYLFPFCTATLLQKNAALSAKHCMPDGLDALYKKLAKRVIDWKIKNNLRMAIGFPIFAIDPELWNAKDNKSLTTMPKKAQFIVEAELFGEFGDDGAMLEDWRKNRDGLLMLRLAKNHPELEGSDIEAYINSKQVIADFTGPFPTVSTSNPIWPLMRRKNNGLVYDCKILSGVGYGSAGVREPHGVKRFNQSHIAELQGQSVYVASDHVTCHGDSGGPLFYNKRRPSVMQLDPSDELETFGILSGGTASWTSIFDVLILSNTGLSDMGGSCSTMSKTSVYLMPFLQSKKIEATLAKWRLRSRQR